MMPGGARNYYLNVFLNCFHKTYFEVLLATYKKKIQLKRVLTVLVMALADKEWF